MIAIGAILAFAVNADPQGFNVHTVGWILMGVGLAGALLSMIFWSSWAGPGYWAERRGPRRTTIIDDGPDY
jgi:hypothetical protein